MLQRLESSRAVGQWSGAHGNSSFGSCSSSLAFDTDKVMSASSKMAQDADEAMSESSWTALAKRKVRDGGEAGVRRSLVRDRRRIRGSQKEDGPRRKGKQRLIWKWMMMDFKKRVLTSKVR